MAGRLPCSEEPGASLLPPPQPFLQTVVDFCGRFVARSLCIILMKHFCSSSVSEDLGCRRGDFSRKHYGSVELVS